MKLAKERTWLEAIIETDSLTVVKLINKDEIDTHLDKTLIGDCKKLKEDMMLELLHVKREGNKCADYLSKLGRTQGEQLMRVMVPSNELVQLIKADMKGVAYQCGD